MNPTRNRLSRSQHLTNRTGDRPNAEYDKFSESNNVLVEKVYPNPNYQLTRSYSGSSPLADEDSPNTTAPSNIWDMDGYSGLHGYLEFTGGTNPTADIELWCYDTRNKKWFYVSRVTAVGALKEFRFADAVRGRHCFFRLANISTDVTSVTLTATGE